MPLLVLYLEIIKHDKLCKTFFRRYMYSVKLYLNFSLEIREVIYVAINSFAFNCSFVFRNGQ